MKHYSGLDISVKETAICIADETGKICRELKVPSHPEDLAEVLKHPAWRLERIGLEAGPLSQWLFSGLVEAGLSAICIETRHAKAFLKAQVNKTDRNDARGIAQMMRVNLFRPVHVKTLKSQKRRALLTARKLLQEKAIDIENDVRGLLRNFGLKVGIIRTNGFESRILELIGDMPDRHRQVNERRDTTRRMTASGFVIWRARRRSRPRPKMPRRGGSMIDG
jgi:transposase